MRNNNIYHLATRIYMHCMQTSTILQFINIQSGPFNVGHSLFQKRNNVFKNIFTSVPRGTTLLRSKISLNI